MRSLIAVLALSLLVMEVSGQTTRFVPSAATPDFASAVAAAINGDVIQLAAGSFSTAGTTFPITKTLVIYGAGMNQTVLHGDMNAAPTAVLSFHLANSDSRIHDLTILPTASGALPPGSIHRQGIRLTPNWTTTTEIKTLELYGVRIQGCHGPAGGGIEATDIAIEAFDCEFDQNVSTGATGGGGAILAEKLTLSGCTFTNNQSAADGGGLYVTGGQVDIVNSRFEANTALGVGGAIAGRSAYVCIFSACRFLGNSATDAAVLHMRPTVFGASNQLLGAYVSFEQCYIQGNQGTGSGRLFDVRSSSFALVSSTIRDNAGIATIPLGLVTASHPQFPGGILIQDSIIEDPVDATLTLTAVPGPSGTPGAPPTSHITIITSIIKDVPNMSAVNITHLQVLALEAAYASISADGYVLLPGSPAVDAASHGFLTSDLDGNSRPVGIRRDIGCFELQNLDPGPAFAGTTSTADLLSFNNSTGGLNRTVTIDAGSVCRLAMEEPVPGQSAPFVLWGYLGVPSPAQAFPIPYAGGSMAFTPQLVDPANPLLFTMTENISPTGGGALMSLPAPWSIVGPSLPYPISMTIQGLIADGTGPLRITNAMTLHTR